MYTIVTSLYILPKCAKTSIVYCGAALPYLCNPIPLGNPENSIALPYITSVGLAQTYFARPDYLVVHFWVLATFCLLIL